MSKNASKSKNNKAAKAGNPASKAATKKGNQPGKHATVNPALSDKKLQQIQAVAASGVTNPEFVEAAVNAIIAAPEPAATPKPEGRDGSKKAAVLALLRREGGVTLGEIAQATDWQLHSIRGFLSGQVTKKMGLKVESTKTEGNQRRYHVGARS